jgi:hypothetical protein
MVRNHDPAPPPPPALKAKAGRKASHATRDVIKRPNHSEPSQTPLGAINIQIRRAEQPVSIESRDRSVAQGGHEALLSSIKMASSSPEGCSWSLAPFCLFLSRWHNRKSSRLSNSLMNTEQSHRQSDFNNFEWLADLQKSRPQPQYSKPHLN